MGMFFMLRVFTNHVGYDADSTKTAVFLSTGDANPTRFTVNDYTTDAVVFSGEPVAVVRL